MQPQILKNRLLQMKGLSFLYNTHLHKVVNFRIDEVEEKVEIVTDKNWFTFPVKEMDKVLDDFVQARSPEEPEEKLSPAVISNGGVSLGKNKTEGVYDILDQTIKNIQNDPKFVAQAGQINKTITNMINLKKLELQAREI